MLEIVDFSGSIREGLGFVFVFQYLNQRRDSFIYLEVVVSLSFFDLIMETGKTEKRNPNEFKS